MAKKVTPTTTEVYGKSANDLNSALQKIESAVQNLQQIANEAKNLELTNADLEERSKALEIEYSQKRATFEFENNLAFQQNKAGFVNGYVKENGLTLVPNEELKTLQGKLADSQKEIDKMVSITTKQLTSQYENEKALLEAKHKTEIVSQETTNKNLLEKVAMLEKQAEMLVKQLESERNASIERSKASAIGTVNFPTSK